MLNKKQLMSIAQIAFIPLAIWGLLANPLWFLASLVVWFLFCCVGVTVTYHRLLSHKSFKAPQWFKVVGSTLAFLGLLATPVEWVGPHRDHHIFADKEGDPHSPKLMGWKSMLYAFHSDVKPNGSVLRIMKDKWMMGIHKYQAIILSLYLIFCFTFAGFYGIVYLWAIPCFLTLWSIILGILNHAEDGPRTLGWLWAIITCGENNHVRHHENPAHWQEDWPISWVINLVRTK